MTVAKTRAEKTPAGAMTCPQCDQPNVAGSPYCEHHDAPDHVHRYADCATCGGPLAAKRSAGAFVDDTWLHVHDSDWKDNPHNGTKVILVHLATCRHRRPGGDAISYDMAKTHAHTQYHDCVPLEWRVAAADLPDDERHVIERKAATT